MLKIQSRFVESVASAGAPTDPGELPALVHQAARLEFATIPPYLTAMLSLRPGSNREVWKLIHSVVVEEMLHMSIACNLLNALGGKPRLNEAAFLTAYPGPLPMAVDDDLVVGLEPFSLPLVERVFMKIEEPEHPVAIAAALALKPGFATIGAFYAALDARVAQLGDRIFIGDPRRQVGAAEWFSSDQLFPIQNAADARRAISIVVEQGEGTATSPLDLEGELAHYYRFDEIIHLKRIEEDPKSPTGYAFKGADIPFDASAVLPLTPNQSLADLDVDSLAGRRAGQFAFVFTKLLNALQKVFDGEAQRFDAAMGLMFELKIAGQILVGLPAVKNGIPTGLNAGPVFAYVEMPAP